MSPDLIFWYALPLKMVMTATIVVAASVAAERSGPFIGALIAALPTSAGSSYFILALEHEPDFVAVSAVGSLTANAVVAVFALTYSALAQRHGITLSIGVATAVWCVAILATHRMQWTPATAVLLNAAIFAVTIPATARYRHDGVGGAVGVRSRWDIPLRALAVALVVATVTTASHWIGSFASGTLAVFPIVMGSFVAIMQPRLGGPTAGAVLAHAQIPLIGLGLAFLGIHYLVAPLGVWWALLAGLAITVGWSGLLWLARRSKLRSAGPLE
ncbi:MAG: hypothetical protein IT537_17820 [Hyphomicrobiales bacterium]|nr:hypothetical protein [Hyphomicrobiales bacterium]